MPNITPEMVRKINERLDEKYRIVERSYSNVDYSYSIQTKLPEIPGSPILADTIKYTNGTNTEQTVMGRISKEFEQSISISLSTSLEIGFEFGVEVGAEGSFMGIGASTKASTKFSSNFSVNTTEEQSYTEITTYENEIPFTIPPLTESRMNALLEQRVYNNVPFTLRFIVMEAPFVIVPRASRQLHRFYLGTTGNHFYTLYAEEGINAGYAEEHMTGYVYPEQVDGTIPIYRRYHPGMRNHFYTISDTEGLDQGYIDEGVGFYAYGLEQPFTTPIYRFYHDGFQDHFYTLDHEEGERAGYRYEGVLCHAIPPSGLPDVDTTTLSPEARNFEIDGHFSGSTLARTLNVSSSMRQLTQEEADAIGLEYA